MNKITFFALPLFFSAVLFCAPCSLKDCCKRTEKAQSAFVKASDFAEATPDKTADKEAQEIVTPSSSSTSRKADYEIQEIFLNRWSPRAMSGQEISDAELMPLFEAARWAPSSYNEQPWRFIYAKRGSKQWDTFLNLLVPFNQEWAKNASVLVVMVSKKNFTHNNEFSVTHSFDAGAAWQNLALQASMNGFVTHGMGGFDYARAAKELNISDEYQVEAMFTIGKPGSTKNLPEYMQKQEVPSGRKPVSEFVFEGTL